jgi:hypothetical protein
MKEAQLSMSTDVMQTNIDTGWPEIFKHTDLKISEPLFIWMELF